MRILMVCLGNICRSPLAEGIMQHLSDQNGLGWAVDSAGTGNWHDGQAPDARSIHIARLKGIDISQQMARQFGKRDFDRFDHIFVMDLQNKQNVLRLASNESQREKVKLILNERWPGEDRIVPDPYHDDDGFEAVYDMLFEACTAFVTKQHRPSR
jgi:protein-tyrosine phosphatase